MSASCSNPFKNNKIMKNILLCFLLIFFCCCSSSEKEPKPTASKQAKVDTIPLMKDTTPIIDYTPIKSFLLDLEKKPLKKIIDNVGYSEDSLFRSQVRNFKPFRLKKAEVETIFKVKETTKLPKRLVKKLAKKQPIIYTSAMFTFDENYQDSVCSSLLIPLDNEHEYLLVIGYDIGWETDFFVLKKQEERWYIIGQFHNFFRYDFFLDFFQNEEGQTVFCYKENFGSGTGIWQFNYYFYLIDGLRIKPVLNILENSNLTGWGHRRSRWVETKVIAHHPLTFKVVFYNFFFNEPNECPEHEVYFNHDSLNLITKWDNSLYEYAPVFNEQLTENQLLSYYIYTPDELFIHAYSEEFKTILEKEEEPCKNVFIEFLKEVMEE